MKKVLLLAMFFISVNLFAQPDYLNCDLPTPETSINGSSSTWLWQCYGEPFKLKAKMPNDYCSEDTYLIEVGEYVNGAVTNQVAINYYPTMTSEWVVVDLYDFVNQYGSNWDFKGGKTYRVKFSAFIAGNWDTWVTEAQYVKFEEATAAIEFVNGSVSNTVYSSQGWAAEVYDFCESDILVDVSASTCHDRYRISVKEFDIFNWQGTGASGNTGYVFSTDAPEAFNLNDIIDFEDNKTYVVSVETAFPYASSNTFLRKTPSSAPDVEGEFVKIRNEEQLYSMGGGFGFTLYEICPYLGDYLFDPSATQCEGRYRIRIAEWDWQNWTMADADPYDSGWVINNLPDQIVMNDLYNSQFQVGKVYILSIEVGSPYDQQAFVFEIPENLPYACIKEADKDRKRIAASSSIDLYPNPSQTGFATLDLGNLISQDGADLSIYKSDGSLLSSRSINGQSSLEIDLSAQAPGMYFIQVKYADEVSVMKFVKQ